MNRNIIRIVLLIQIVFISAQSGKACTVISATQGDVVLAAANKDWDNISTRILFLPTSEGKYGRVYFGYQVSQGFQNSGGMNDQGLWYDGASLPERSDIENHYNKPTVEGELCEKALEECASVDEVIQMYTQYYSPHWQGHSMWADKYGNSVIIEYGEKDIVFIQKHSDYQVMTNFYISDSTNARWYNCYRFNTAEYMLKNTAEISIDLFRSTLDAVHAEGSMPTVYSNIYDLKNGEIYVFNFHNYNESVKLNLEEQFKKGEQYLKLPELFNEVKLRYPISGEIVDYSSINFEWDGDVDNYLLYYSTNPNFTDCEPIVIGTNQLIKYADMRLFSILLIILLIGSLGLSKRKTTAIIIYLATVCLFVSCDIPIITSPYSPSEIKHSHTVENLQSSTLYYWKVVTIVENGISNESIVQTFITED
jgi:hypothetical protein